LSFESSEDEDIAGSGVLGCRTIAGAAPAANC
jgi:hypothetical protein